MKPKIRIFDSAFTPFAKSASLREENIDIYPTYFEWTDNDNDAIPGLNVYTDGHIKTVDRPGAVAWLLEPPHLRPENYLDVVGHADKFDLILTYDKSLLEVLDNARFYPFGGSSIAFDKWGLHPKTKDVCMILSNKTQTQGQQLRHEIAARFGDRIDLYGFGVGKPFRSKFEVLKDYRYCVVVESGISDWYFTEKLIDCFAVGTVPIYWGCSKIGKFFDMEAIHPFFTLGDLGTLLTSILWHKPEAQRTNLRNAEKSRVCEDWFPLKFKRYLEIR